MSKRKELQKKLTELKENNKNIQKPKLWQCITGGFIP